MFDAVIFDWDGTLADTRQAVVASFQKALKEKRCTISDAFIERRIGTGAAETFREILRTSKVHFDEALIKSLVSKKIQAEIKLSSSVPLFKGAVELLASLQGKVRLALASMNNRAVIDHMIKVLNVQRFFDVVLTMDEVHNSKPDPEIFLKSALQLNVRPDRCVVVEDSVFGVQAAKTANMGCIAVLTGVYSREELERVNPDLVVDSLTEKDEILKFILR
ncbi:MAG: HAD family phosphatase [Candidatus Bathyarchaeota archaeon]|nr:HAD family phosphatase [Candidatus Bathyarchaeota archaeon]